MVVVVVEGVRGKVAGFVVGNSVAVDIKNLERYGYLSSAIGRIKMEAFFAHG